MTPYDNYKETEEWEIISSAISDLTKNNDIVLLTADDYIIGYLVKQLLDRRKSLKKMMKRAR